MARIATTPAVKPIKLWRRPLIKLVVPRLAPQYHRTLGRVALSRFYVAKPFIDAVVAQKGVRTVSDPQRSEVGRSQSNDTRSPRSAARAGGKEPFDGPERLQRRSALGPNMAVPAVTGTGRIGAAFFTQFAETFGAKVQLAKPFAQSQRVDNQAVLAS